jgi:hypothetical protein
MTGKNRFWLIMKASIVLALQLWAPAALFAAPTAVTTSQELNFGTFAGGSGISGTVTVDASGTRFSSGGVILLGSAYAPARFTITGNAGDPYLLTLPAGFTLLSGSNQMGVSAVTPSIPVAGVLPAGGTLPFTVGGTLTVNSSQRNSTYSGTFMITVK